MSRPLTPEEQRKVNKLMGYRKRSLRYCHRCYPRWREGMPVKEYVRAYRMDNISEACFRPDEIYFLPKEG